MISRYHFEAEINTFELNKEVDKYLTSMNSTGEHLKTRGILRKCAKLRNRNNAAILNSFFNAAKDSFSKTHPKIQSPSKTIQLDEIISEHQYTLFNESISQSQHTSENHATPLLVLTPLLDLHSLQHEAILYPLGD